MKRCLVFLFFLCTMSGYSASVLWNDERLFLGGGVDHEEEKGYWYIWLDLLEYDDAYFIVDMITETNGGGMQRRLYGDRIDVGREHWFVVANEGDEINAETTKDSSRLFITNTGKLKFEDSVKPEYMGNVPWTMYLGFETRNYGTRVYGWLELFVDDYTISLGNTCLDLSGRPVIVGIRPEEPIPEPATSALTLLGAAMLFRRRRERVR